MATIIAKYPGKCASCWGAIQVGDQIEWKKGSPTRHTRCPSAKRVKTASSSSSRSAGHGDPNRRGDYCLYCGVFCKPGKGQLLDRDLLEDMDEFGLANRMRARWGVACADTATCKARQEEALVARERAAAEAEGTRRGEAFRAAEVQADLEAATAGLVRTSYTPVGTIQRGASIGAWKSGAFNCSASHAVLMTPEGATIPMVVEQADGFDDWRTYYYLPQGQVDAAIDAWTARHK